jgi:hypothetical protein
MWNILRSSRLRLHQVIRRQCRIIISSPRVRQCTSLKSQQEASKAKIISYSVEIAATVPQLAGYLTQLTIGQTTEPVLSSSSPEAIVDRNHVGPPRLARITGTVDYSAHFGEGPSPFRRGTSPERKPSQMSAFFSDCDSEGPHNDDASENSSRSDGSHSASIFHILFQLYHLRSISILPESFKDWLQGRIVWLEKITVPADLARLRDMISKNPSDGFPIDDVDIE